ncbi:membrane-anchored protein [Rhizobium sp. CC1099]|uniref:membrane-anchored protein n=1 Tax=Rhizobium sp. CC1099 TaxID=3039160 RepID=UPI0024B26DB8|nr:membrane-anchored protein [Rhizobium sp. CC1099]WFU86285.1 membrane-anchored protein [Rhizobium sp. CC1099]
MSISQLRKRVYRTLKYKLARPSPPDLRTPFRGPVVVVGSAPQANLPAGLDRNFSIVTVNGSQAVTKNWGIERPDITFMQFNQIRGQNTNAVEVRRVLRGQSTKALYVFLWPEGEEALKAGLSAFHYQYESLTLVNKYERMALLDKVCGLRTAEMDASEKCSNGVNAVLFAFCHGASEVIITGINPRSTGHAYNNENLGRLHQTMDEMVFSKLLRDGWPLYTADPQVSSAIGIPLWMPA